METVNPNDLLGQHCGDSHRVAVAAVGKAGRAFVPGGTGCALSAHPVPSSWEFVQHVFTLLSTARATASRARGRRVGPAASPPARAARSWVQRLPPLCSLGSAPRRVATGQDM